MCVCLGSGCIVKMGFSVGFESMGVVFLELIMEGRCLCCYSALLPHFSCLLKMGLCVCSKEIPCIGTCSSVPSSSWLYAHERETVIM